MTTTSAFYVLIAVLATLMFVDRPFELWRYVYWLPGLNFIRVPSRFIILTMLALSVLAGFGFDRLVGALLDDGRERSRWCSCRRAAARGVLELSVRRRAVPASTFRRSIAGSIRSPSRS